MSKNYIIIFIIISIFIFMTSFYFIIKNTKNNKKNLIIGFIFNYSWSRVRNYFISLAKVGFKNCDIVMFVKGLSRDTLEKIKSFGVIIYPIPDNPFFYKNSLCYRWEVYANFLKENKDKYNIVFTCDIRDSIFQKDIFEYYNYDKPFFGVGLEDFILSNKLNKAWLLKIVDENLFYNFFANKPVICAGVLIGTPDKFIELQSAFKKIYERKIITADQGILNYLIYYEKLFNDSLIVRDHYNGYIMSLAGTNRARLNLDKDDNVLNYNGQIAAVVHQYDRHYDITYKFNRKFNERNFNFSSYKKESLINVKLTTNKIIIIIFIFIIIIAIIIYIFHKLKNYYQKLNKKRRKTRIKIYRKKRKKKKHSYIQL